MQCQVNLSPELILNLSSFALRRCSASLKLFHISRFLQVGTPAPPSSSSSLGHSRPSAGLAWSDLNSFLGKAIIFCDSQGPQMTFLRKWSFFFTHGGPQLTFLMQFGKVVIFHDTRALHHNIYILLSALKSAGHKPNIQTGSGQGTRCKWPAAAKDNTCIKTFERQRTTNNNNNNNKYIINKRFGNKVNKDSRRVTTDTSA